MMPLRFITAGAAILALMVVMLGAYTRLTNAGLGCPDWPGCYGHFVLPSAEQARSLAQQNYPAQPIEARKAWTEMIHRYAAGSLAVLILLIAVDASWRRLKQQPAPFKLSILLLGLVLFQAALGMWTVTMKLLPIVVMSHLLGGILIFSCLCRLNLVCNQVVQFNLTRWRQWVMLGFVIVILQIALGGWVSSNYAGIACIGFPQCNGQWLPPLHWSKGFNLLLPVGANYQGGLLDNDIRMTIQYVHRIGAVITALYCLGLALLLLNSTSQTTVRRLTLGLLSLVMIQFMLGVINVTHLLPLWAAVLHNGVAALLAATLLMILYLTQGKYQHAG